MPTVGGQAVIEGVMMRNGDKVSVAVRREKDKEIVVNRITPRNRFQKLSKIPFVRGIFNLYDMVSLGVKALNLSAKLALEEEEEEFGTREAILTFGLAILLAVGGFVILPLYLTNLFEWSQSVNPLLFNLMEGGIRIGLFLAYIYGISLLKDIRRVFEYHGAEHKSVYAYENGEELTVENTREFSTLHPRCGTAFLLIVLIVAILVFSLAGNPPLPIKILSRLLLLPVVAGVSYEALRFSGRHQDKKWLRWMIAPGLWLQKITTKPPSDSQLEVALAALKEVVQKP